MKKLFSMVLCAMMALTLAGCGGSGDDSSTYTYSSELDIKNLDSADAEDGCSFTALHAIIDGLMKPAKDGTTTYGIAKSSEVSEDGLTHTYKLRDAKWSNGDPVTANDFVYAWHRIFKNKGNYYYMFCDGIANIAGAQELSDKIDAEQDLTEDDLRGLSDEQLEIARNEIYARHGYQFKQKKMKNYFNSSIVLGGQKNVKIFKNIFNNIYIFIMLLYK